MITNKICIKPCKCVCYFDTQFNVLNISYDGFWLIQQKCVLKLISKCPCMGLVCSTDLMLRRSLNMFSFSKIVVEGGLISFLVHTIRTLCWLVSMSY